MDTKNPKSFMAAKLTARAAETSNMKNAQVFNIGYTPNEILIRTELERVTDDLADYVNLTFEKRFMGNLMQKSFYTDWPANSSKIMLVRNLISFRDRVSSSSQVYTWHFLIQI